MDTGGGSERDLFVAAFPRLRDLALRASRGMLRSPDLAEEAAQEALTRLWTRWDKLVDHPNHEAWIMTTCFYVCMEMGRKRRRLSLVPVEDVARYDSSIFERPLLVAALKKLSERQRLVVMARHYYDLSVEQTAELLGISQSKVLDATFEAVRNLRRKLDPDELLGT